MVGQVSVEEKNEIQRLFERRNGLNELAKIVTAENEALYERPRRDGYKVSGLVGLHGPEVSMGE